MEYAIFDFDKTLVKKHSFAAHSMSNYIGVPAETIYEAGRAYAAVEKKVRAEDYFKYDAEHITAIATYHNNPAFVAGVVSVLLGKKLIYASTTVHGTEPLAIASYAIEGGGSFPISYIPKLGDEFAAAKTRLEAKGKNDQIQFLRTTLGLDDVSVSFYDDTSSNVDAVSRLANTNGFLVSAHEDTFTILRPHRVLDAESSDDDDTWDAACLAGGAAVPDTGVPASLGRTGSALFAATRVPVGGSGVHCEGGAFSPARTARTPGRC